jgi:hypothetical protein
MISFAIPYAVTWAVRLFGVRHVLRAPRFYGPDWCCDCRVAPGFYENEGRALMRSLQARVLMPLVVEAALGMLLWSQGRFLAAGAMEASAAAAAYLFHLSLLRGVAWRAWRYAVPVPDPVSSLAVSLRQRKIADYQRPWLEWTLRGAVGVVLVLLGVALARPDAGENVARLVGLPGVTLYAVLGLMLAKHAAAAWRVFGTPAVSPEQFMEVQDAARRHLALVCDYLRAVVLTPLLCWVALQGFPGLRAARLYLLVGPLAAVALVGLAPLVQSERQLVKLGRNLRTPLDRYRPVAATPPEGSFYLVGRLCFRPGETAMLMRGPGGLALNGSSLRTRAWLVYGAGWIVIGVAMVAWK